MSRVVNTDTLLGAAGLAASAVLLVSSYRQGATVFLLPGDAPPFLVPQLFLYLLAAISVAILLGGLRRGGVRLDARNWRAIGVGFATLVAATALMKPLGYLVVAPVAVFVTVLNLGYRNLLVNAAVSVGIVALLYLLLVSFAQMPLPTVPGLGI
ncbi:MAG: tripartite tricarboxylate transporter TctB family protein [Rhodobacteraceae bacterium]|nr:tripartite tricarboxylate transporter TctB family protein [Paracoccaceae bacterium]